MKRMLLVLLLLVLSFNYCFSNDQLKIINNSCIDLNVTVYAVCPNTCQTAAITGILVPCGGTTYICSPSTTPTCSWSFSDPSVACENWEFWFAVYSNACSVAVPVTNGTDVAVVGTGASCPTTPPNIFGSLGSIGIGSSSSFNIGNYACGLTPCFTPCNQVNASFSYNITWNDATITFN